MSKTRKSPLWWLYKVLKQPCVCFLVLLLDDVKFYEITAFFIDIRSGSHDKLKCKRTQTRVKYTTEKETQAYALTKGMENFSFRCAYVCISHV